MEVLFWLAFVGVFYAYLGYPLLLLAWPRRRAQPPALAGDDAPCISLIIPVHNEAAVLVGKLDNTLSLHYPADRLEILLVADGCTDATVEIARRYEGRSGLRVIELPERGGKANALNRGLAEATGELVVFTDASILLREDALAELARPFADPLIGCVSGEDLIAGSGGEAAYGRYELFLRQKESEICSIVGASGCFYAQRRALCAPFVAGLAPDFLSVLHTVEQGYRAVTAPAARGSMASVRSARSEFQRKVRTLLRGISTLFYKRQLLNPMRFKGFALLLLSHKLMRWLVPFWLILMLVSSGLLALTGQPVYQVLFVLQLLFYALGVSALAGPLGGLLPGKIAAYFTSVNVAILAAWLKYAQGERQEVWDPSNRIA